MISDRLIDPLVDLLFVRGRVDEVRLIAPQARLVRLTGPALRELEWLPGQHVRVSVGDLREARTWLAPRDVLRTYSVWSYDGEALELCVLDHTDGPGTRWSREVAPGDEVAFRPPDGRLVAAPDAPYHLFAGEDTASVAFGPMLAALPADARVYAAVEVASVRDRLPLPRDEDITWCYRGEAPAASSQTLVAAVRDLPLPAGPGTAYVAGEARTCQAVREHLVRERGWPRRSVIVKPFWTPGRRGMD